MRKALSRAEVGELDRRAIHEFGLPGIILMENAGRGAAEILLSLGARGRVVICCGKGNNGGDGFVMARHLDLHRVDVRVLLFCRPEELQGDAKTNFEVISRSKLSLEVFAANIDPAGIGQELAAAEWIVDALFGTGLQGPVRSPYDKIIELINGSGAKILAVDIPSGLEGDTGQPLGPTVRAHHTVTFVSLKAGFLLPSSQEWTGKIDVVDIGAPRGLVEEFLGETYIKHARNS